MGKGHSASDAANVPKKVLGTDTKHETAVRCVGDSVARHLDLSKVHKESGRKVERDTEETREDSRCR